MKKVMIVLVAFAVITTAKAASVNWDTGNMSALPSYATMWQGQAVSFYLTTSGFDLTTIIDGLKVNDKSVLAGQTLDLGTKTLGGAPTYRASGVGLKTTFAEKDVAYGYAVVWNKGVFDDKTLDFAITKVVASAAFGPAGNANLNFGGIASGNWTTYDVVPEPTSMALLALGVAAVGLRRKFRK